jgi:NADH-quinone oxidoreductase subunit J
MFTITVMTSQALYALTAMAAGMIFISAFFFILGADFLGVIQIIVYTGAVMALYAFGMMFFDTTRTLVEKRENPRTIFLLGVIAATLVVFIVISPIISTHLEARYPIEAALGNSQSIGLILFTKFLVPFEVAAVMLLVAMIAGIVLAGKKMDKSLTLMAEEEIALMNAAQTTPDSQEGAH